MFPHDTLVFPPDVEGLKPLSSPLRLTLSERQQLVRLAQAHGTSQALARRVRIVLTAYAHPAWSSKSIAQSLNLNDRLVRTWRRRWQEAHSLKDVPRSGSTRRFSSHVRAQVTTLSCSLPCSHGVPLALWSHAELARQVTTGATLPTISTRTIGRWLTAEQIRP